MKIRSKKISPHTKIGSKKTTNVPNKQRNNSIDDYANSKIATGFPEIIKIATNKGCQFATVPNFRKVLSLHEQQNLDDLLREQTAYSVLLDKALEKIKELKKNISSNSNRRLLRVIFRKKNLKKASVNKVVEFFNKQNIELKLIIIKQNSARTIVKFFPKDTLHRSIVKKSKQESFYQTCLKSINRLIKTKRFKEQKTVFLRFKLNSKYSSTFKSIFSQLKTHFDNEGYELILQDASISVSEKYSKPHLLVRGDLSSFINNFQSQFESFSNHVAQTSLIKDKMVIAVEKQYYENDELFNGLFFNLKGIRQFNIKRVLSVNWVHEGVCFSFRNDDKFLYTSIKIRNSDD